VTTHLWESDHPYYAAEGSYFATGWHAEYESWADFIEEQGENDLDLNLLYRWDWEVPEPGDEPGESVALFFIHQRKACTRSARVAVTREDEPSVREYLTVRAAHLRTVWAPLLGEDATP
jgi:hypothetical protein